MSQFKFKQYFMVIRFYKRNKFDFGGTFALISLK